MINETTCNIYLTPNCLSYFNLLNMSLTPYKNEKALLQLIQEGNEQAFKNLFDTYRSRLFYYISRIVKSDEIAEELVMDVFLKIWLARKLITQIENFDGFLFRIAHNKTIDFLRSVSKDARLHELLWEEIQIAGSFHTDSLLLTHEYEGKIREAIVLLSPKQRKVYEMCRQQDCTHDQVANYLFISKSTVNNHLVNSQRFIRNYISKNLDLGF